MPVWLVIGTPPSEAAFSMMAHWEVRNHAAKSGLNLGVEIQGGDVQGGSAGSGAAPKRQAFSPEACCW